MTVQRCMKPALTGLVVALFVGGCSVAMVDTVSIPTPRPIVTASAPSPPSARLVADEQDAAAPESVAEAERARATPSHHHEGSDDRMMGDHDGPHGDESRAGSDPDASPERSSGGE